MSVWLRRRSSEAAQPVHLQAGVGTAQCSLGVGSSNETSDKGRPTKRELEVHVLLKVSAERSQAKVIGQLEGGGGDGELRLNGRRQQWTDAV